MRVCRQVMTDFLTRVTASVIIGASSDETSRIMKQYICLRAKQERLFYKFCYLD